MENWWREGLQYFSSCTIYPITFCFRIIKAAAFGHSINTKNNDINKNSLPNNKDTIRLMLIGDSKVGKTNLISRFTENKFNENYVGTIGIDSKCHLTKNEIDGTWRRLHIWDISGHEEFWDITMPYVNGCHGILVVYDVTSSESFGNVKRWISEVNFRLHRRSQDVGSRSKNFVKLMALVGNKCEDQERRTVLKDVALQFASEMGMKYVETSAKENINVDQIFSGLLMKSVHDIMM